MEFALCNQHCQSIIQWLFEILQLSPTEKLTGIIHHVCMIFNVICIFITLGYSINDGQCSKLFQPVIAFFQLDYIFFNQPPKSRWHSSDTQQYEGKGRTNIFGILVWDFMGYYFKQMQQSISGNIYLLSYFFKPGKIRALLEHFG